MLGRVKVAADARSARCGGVWWFTAGRLHGLGRLAFGPVNFAAETEGSQGHLQQTPEPLLRRGLPRAGDRPQLENKLRLLWAPGIHGLPETHSVREFIRPLPCRTL